MNPVRFTDFDRAGAVRSRMWVKAFGKTTYTLCRVCRKVKLADDQKSDHGGVCWACRNNAGERHGERSSEGKSA